MQAAGLSRGVLTEQRVYLLLDTYEGGGEAKAQKGREREGGKGGKRERERGREGERERGRERERGA